MPPEQFDDMKKSLNIGGTLLEDNFQERIQMVKVLISNILDGLKRINYTLISPEYSLKDLLPQLKIGDDGMSQINIEEVMEGMHFEPEYYLKFLERDIAIQAIKSNPNFDIYNIIITIYSLNLLDSPSMDPLIKEIISSAFASVNLYEFKTKNSTLSVEISSEKKFFDKVTFSVGGKSSRYFNKPGYNIKIRGKEDLYGRTQFKFRPDASEPTYLRSKLASDIHKSLGIKGISSNYATLYINDEYLGLFIISDTYKLSWIEYEYGEKDTTSLYKCESNLESNYQSNSFINQNENITDLTEIMELLKTFDEAQSAADIENIFDVDNFLKELAIEYLLGSWDNFNNANNFFLYKQPNGKWIYLTYDFDNSFGANLDTLYCGVIYVDFPERMAECIKDHLIDTVEEYFKPLFKVEVAHMIDILILKDPSRFEKILSNIVKKVFNPATLYPHIDELKELIKPFIEKEKIRNKNGIYPGGYNLYADTINSFDEWDANSEFTMVKTLLGLNAYGLKYWILGKYRYVCKTYKLECDPIYIDKNYQYSINKEVEFKRYDISDIPLLSNVTNITNETPIVNITTEIETPTITSIPTFDYKCLAELIGYPCCPSIIKTIYAQDEYGDWGFDFKKQEWCGLTPYTGSSVDDECWSKIYGYSCCKRCMVYETDENGKWGFESNQWCGIPASC
ncbi:hypothetical protein BCR32DRAFT_234398 [Anaeromyces robustus]|uniref:CBM10 domain-containing protein n=1 Tax=Anaeromyces robustus TaxID=1754192 RepID=A0A1Y1X089_9FUNG|nr:hypothetical protein BCR32DRAFT_234398 [Anaeromyces robustus]|eukprot:ORX79231.1 hypothetical protein BCR32DRAFT_234398 [Anaeromyces robustus]